MQKKPHRSLATPLRALAPLRQYRCKVADAGDLFPIQGLQVSRRPPAQPFADLLDYAFRIASA